MFKLKILLSASFFLNMFFMMWLVRAYSTILNYTYESSTLQKSLLFNYDKIFLGIEERKNRFLQGRYRSMEQGGDFLQTDFDSTLQFLHDNMVSPDNWVFDYRSFLVNNNVEAISIIDWFKRLDHVGEVVNTEGVFSLFSYYFYYWFDKFCSFIFKVFGFQINPDNVMWIVLVIIIGMMFISFFTDPFLHRFDVLERRIYLHERFLEEKLNNGSPIQMPDYWKMKEEAYYTQKDAWKSRAYYNINQSFRTSDYHEPTI